jgi:hypothetical protein
MYVKYGAAATFDLVDVQLYETWARADQAVNALGIDPAAYLVNLTLTTTQTGGVAAPVLFGMHASTNDRACGFINTKAGGWTLRRCRR